eukprot:CAMPEP_0175899534 /NCGR_PEP_ID=MMETSP0108-20121206/1852_1 /TAXON_ID=195067 ORGANISM="Goniomonas pacifica, Strain CCMP1869" /NCGR_SAMPLE_ID=MMETSP0108 /ASSEMBLY_ACC=CAM_ASM_000204 /LENGTH=48 /DNA_ID= /DNA_START= /DNA_END= /DNA_ORIENTATION=
MSPCRREEARVDFGTRDTLVTLPDHVGRSLPPHGRVLGDGYVEECEAR